MKTTLFLVVLLLSLNSEGASEDRSAEDIAAIAAARKAKSASLKEWRAANPEKMKIYAEKQKKYYAANQKRIAEQRKEHRAANRKRITEQEKASRAARKMQKKLLQGALSRHELLPLGDKDKVEPVDLASFAFGAGDKKRPRSDGADGGPATKK